ncbi:hypothetical protein CBS101457_005971 [Exobasidium rhododendri]|nr:hypothetical protein CBS101457_005971 [Exobasidium rhododendri]
MKVRPRSHLSAYHYFTVVATAAASSSAFPGLVSESYNQYHQHQQQHQQQQQQQYHRITGSQKQYIIVNSDEPQLYKLFGILPFLLNTIKTQFITTALVTIFLGLPLLVYFYLRPRHPYADWTSRLPDSIVHLLFYARLEFTECKDILLAEIMSLTSAPLGLGMNIAATVSSWSPFGSRELYRGDAKGTSRPRTGRSLLGRRSRMNRASSSKAESEHLIGSSSNHYAGIYNTGNSCFLNSTLQSLASLDQLRDHLESIMQLAEIWDVPTPVTDALFDLITELNRPLAKRSALIPRQLTDALSRLPQTNVGSFFYAHQQQDAHELLVLLTSAIDDEMKIIMSERRHSQRNKAVGLQAAVAPSVPTMFCSSSYATTSTNPFRSLIAQRTACLDCGYVEAVRHYPADELSLAVPYRAGSATTVESCLQMWSQLERVDWICFRCSLRKTLEKIRGDVKRMSDTSPLPNGHSTKDNGHSNGYLKGQDTSPTKMTNSRKKKLREVRRKEAVLTSILEGAFSEDEIESARLLEKADIRLERTFSSLSTKQVMIARTPKILLLHLNRSSYNASNFGASKNNSRVYFEEYLDLSDVVTNGELNISGNLPISKSREDRQRRQASMAVDEDDGYLVEEQSKTLYRLCGIVVHYGSHSAGHYVSFRRRNIKRSIPADDADGQTEIRNDVWFRISDDSVSPCSLTDVLTQNPFILFFERIDAIGGGRHSPQARSLNTSLPPGFEAFGKTDLQKQWSTFQPRVVERWNYVH